MQNQDQIILDLKLAAYRLKLEQQKNQDKLLSKEIEIIKQEKIIEYDRIQSILTSNLKESLKISIPFSLFNMFVFKSILIFPLTISCTFLIYSMKTRVKFNYI